MTETKELTQEQEQEIAAKVLSDWKTKPEIRAEFKTILRYEAYLRAEALGKVHVCGKG